MKPLPLARVALSVSAGSALVWIAASCASQGDGDPPRPSEDAAGADTRSTIIEPDAPNVEHCRDGRWCAVTSPVDIRVSLNGIWGTSESDVWIAASPDIAIHWNGSDFRSTRLKTNHTLYGIWGSSSQDVWAFATGNVLWHKVAGEEWDDGSAEDRDAAGDPPPWSGPIYGMWGRSASDVWAVGPSVDTHRQPTVWHADGWNGGAPKWTSTVTSPGAGPSDREPSFNAIWGNSSGEVWVVGDKGRTRYSTGWKNEATPWFVVDSWTSLPLFAVWGASTGEIWAAGGGGAVRRFKRLPDDTVSVEQVPFPNRATIRALWGFSGDDIWAAGSEGTLAHWDGTAWSLVDLTSTVRRDSELFAIWASSPEDIWVVGRATLLHKGKNLLPGTMP